MSSFQEFSFGEGDENVGTRTKRFKAEAGRTYRASLAWWSGIEDGDLDLTEDPDNKPRFIGAQRNYIKDVGYVINRGPEFTKLAGGEPPRMAIATILINWPMDSKGNLDKAAIAAGDFQVHPWVIGQDKYKTIEPIHKEFHFGTHDLKMMCSDTQFQKITFSPCKDSLLAAIKEKGGKLWKKIVADVQQVAANIQNEIGREMTLDQIREKLTGSPGGNPAAPAMAMATEEIDSLVDNLLEDE